MTKSAMPRDAVVDRMMLVINGQGDAADDNRFGYMTRERAVNTIDFFKAAFDNPITEQNASEEFKKSVTIATGLTYYDLRAPALNLFPTVTPLRNSLPRAQRPNPGDAAHWKSVDAIIGSGMPYMGWVPEGKRSASMAYTTSDHSLSYRSLGEEDSLTDEAMFAAKGFEDENALVQLRLLLKMFVKEEAALLAGNQSRALGTPTTPTLAQSGSTGTLPTLTYSVIVVALTPEGYLNSSLTNGVATSLLITGNDGGTYTLNGGSSQKSAAATQAITLGQILSATVPLISGAVAYAWFVGAAGAETLQAITTINSATFSVPLTGSRQAATAVTADCSKNTNYAFDGILITLLTASNAYVKQMATGVAGTGTPLTSSGGGGVVEMDTMFQSMWDSSMISPTVVYVNSQEQKNITAKVLNGTSAPLLRYNSDAQGSAEYKITAAGVVSFYFNPYTADGGIKMPIKIHPNMPPGTILSWAEVLPPWYVSNNVPEVAQVLTRQDYYAEVWPKTTRTQYYGVYSQEVLAVYATFAGGLITNIGNG